MVESGGGQHLYWLLKEPAKRGDIATVENINRRIAHALGGDMGNVDAARILPVPNTHNYKYKPPRRVKIRDLDKAYYSLDDFDSLPAEESIQETDQLTSAGTAIADYVMPIDDFCKRDIKPRETILDPWLKDPCMIMVWAKRGVGKTFWVMTLLDALSKGSDFGPWKCEKPVNTLFLDGEMPEEDLLTRSFDLGIYQRKRLLRKAKGDLANHRPYMKRKKKFMILSAASMVKSNAPSPNLLNPQVRDDLKAILIKNKIKVLAIDNLTSLSPGIDENSKKDYDPINRWLIELRSHGISTIIVHHAGKSGEQRGTSGREDNLDISIKLEHPSGYSIEEGAKFEVRFSKARVPGNDLKKITNIEMCLNEQPGHVWDWDFTDIKSETDNAKQVRDYEILKLRETGLNQKAIAEELDISQPLVSNVIRDAKDRKFITAKDEKLTEKGKEYYGDRA